MRRIDTFEVFTLLFVSKAALLLTAKQTPAPDDAAAALTGLLCGGAINCALAAPLLVYAKKGPGLPGKGMAAPLWAAFLAAAAASAAGLTMFMSTGAYGKDALIVLALMTAAAAYAAKLGIEPLARFSAIAFAALAASFVLLALGTAADVETGRLARQAVDRLPAAAETALLFILRPEELLALTVLAAFQRGRTGTAFFAYNISSVLLCGAIFTVAPLALGSYAGTQEYPVFALAASAGIYVFQRLDSLFLAVWILASFIRTSLYLWLAVTMASAVFPKIPRGWMVTLNSLLMLLAAFAWAKLSGEADAKIKFMTGVGTVALLLAWPAVGILKKRRGER